jgi:hypothetical protein
MTNLYEWQNGSLAIPQLLIVMSVFLAFAIAAPFAILIYQVIKFKKLSFDKSFMTKWLMAIIFIALAVSLIFNIMSFVFYFGQDIFSNTNFSTAKTMVIVFIVLDAVIGVGVYLTLIFANQYMAVGISKEVIYIFGEIYQTEKVISIVQDGKHISLHIGVGKRVVKRIRFAATSMCGQCVQSATAIIGVGITEGKDKEIYIAEVQKRQDDFRKSMTKSSSASTTSAAKTSKTSKTSKASAAKAAPSEVKEDNDDNKAE